MNNSIFLPGSNRQLEILMNYFQLNLSTILIIGSGCEEIARILREKKDSSVTIIVDDNDALINTRISLAKEKDVYVKLMDYANTDFHDETFDLIYAQASISSANRNKIIKEIKRILKPNGYFCVGEIVKLSDNTPKFIKDIWENSNLFPLHKNNIANYYLEKGFEILIDEDLSETLEEYYLDVQNKLIEKYDILSPNEKSYYKKLLKQISHESNAYLKLGGDKHIGFKVLVMKKEIIK